MTIRSLHTEESEGIATAVQAALRGTTSLDVVYVATKKSSVMLGEFPSGPAGASTLFQTDLGIVRWNGPIDLLARARGTFDSHFEVRNGSPILYPISAERHRSFDNRQKLLVYFGVKLDEAEIQPKAGIQFCNIFWAEAVGGKSWYEHLAGLRTADKRRHHARAIEKALNFQHTLTALAAA